MKTPLRYQVTEFDCGPTAVMNAISYLYSTEEIPPDFVKNVYMHTLDDYDVKGFMGRKGTSPDALRFLTTWFNRYAVTTNFPIHCEYFEADQVNLQDDGRLITCLKSGGVAVVKCILEVEHYVTLTGIDDEYVHVFDPYFWDLDFGKKGIVRVSDHPMEYNRLISRDIMECSDGCDYAFCRTEKRVSMLFSKTGRGKNFVPQT